MNTLSKTKQILNKYQISANKRFGQNFLIDDNILQNIVDVSNLNKDELVVEIGPGLGNLTEYLINEAGHVLLIEIDKNMIDILNDRFSGVQNYSLINQDILKVNLDDIIEDLENTLNKKFKAVKVVANLPYYITTPILFKLLQDSKRVSDIVVMVQKEVAERMVANYKTKDYGILTVMVEYLSEAEIKIIVPNSSFIPAPNVTSAVIKLTKNKRYECLDEKVLFELIHSAFAQRRKKIVNSLVDKNFHNLSKEELVNILNKLEIKETARAEELKITDFIDIVELICKG